MNKHATDVYTHAVNYMNDKKTPINHNILEFVCRYHHCVKHQFNNRKELFTELRKYFSLTTTGVIIQLISALSKGKEGKTFPEYKMYLEALKYGENQSKSDMVAV